MEREILDVASVHDTGGIYSHVVRAGDLLFLSGQVALDTSGELVGPGDIELQARQVFRNLAGVLKDSGSDLDRIIKMTTFLVGRETLPGYRLVRDEILGRPVPANTLVFIEGLAHPGYLVEIEAIAIAGVASPARSPLSEVS